MATHGTFKQATTGSYGPRSEALVPARAALLGPLAVEDLEPGVGQCPEFGNRLHEMRVEDLRAIRPVEAFDLRVLIGLAGLNVLDGPAVSGAPIHEGLRGKLCAIVHANRRGTAMHGHEMFEFACHTAAG